MATEGNIDYALARVHARYGKRLDEGEWRRLEASRDYAHYLDAIHGSELAEFTSSLNVSQDSHDIDRALRAEWRRYVTRVASWHPREWQSWLAWLAWLPSLSLIAQLVHAESAPPWMMADPLLGPIAPGVVGERVAATKGTALAPFAAAIGGRGALADVWRARWQALRPPADADTRALLDALSRACARYRHALEQASESSARPRAQLVERLTRLFRAGAGTIVATVCQLALLAFDLERLRGGLVNRRALPTRAAETA